MPLPVTGIVAGPRDERDTDTVTRGRSRRHAHRHGSAAIALHVREAAARNGLPESLVAAVISVESEFNPRAVSRRGAIGLMQLMPSTAAMLGVRDAFDPGQNVEAGARHLRDLIDRFSGDVPLALAAYNAGAQNVLKHNGVPPYPETRAFVARVLSRAGMMAMPAVAGAHARPVTKTVAAPVPTATAVSAPRAQSGRQTVEQMRAATTDATVTPAAFADGRTAANASPASEVSAPAPPTDLLQSEAP